MIYFSTNLTTFNSYGPWKCPLFTLLANISKYLTNSHYLLYVNDMAEIFGVIYGDENIA